MRKEKKLFGMEAEKCKKLDKIFKKHCGSKDEVLLETLNLLSTR